jgi:hypothetical protein
MFVYLLEFGEGCQEDFEELQKLELVFLVDLRLFAEGDNGHLLLECLLE